MSTKRDINIPSIKSVSFTRTPKRNCAMPLPECMMFCEEVEMCHEAWKKICKRAGKYILHDTWVESLWWNNQDHIKSG
eukprot:snap_masked-scaffold_36-processed-gene-0.41-mRNA-1 protein AED:1.00 eAED:1.00 QI:0/0/0/0/1/1/2/0/77